MKWTILLSLFALSNAFVEDHYTVTNGELGRSGNFVCPTGALVIPDTVHGSAVTSIKFNAFRSCSLTSLDLSQTKVTTVGYGAFLYNPITSFKLPSSLNVIGSNAFHGTYSSTAISSVTYTVAKPSGIANLPTCTDPCVETVCNNLGTLVEGSCECNDRAVKLGDTCELLLNKATKAELQEAYKGECSDA